MKDIFVSTTSGFVEALSTSTVCPDCFPSVSDLVSFIIPLDCLSLSSVHCFHSFFRYRLGIAGPSNKGSEQLLLEHASRIIVIHYI